MCCKKTSLDTLRGFELNVLTNYLYIYIYIAVVDFVKFYLYYLKIIDQTFTYNIIYYIGLNPTPIYAYDELASVNSWRRKINNETQIDYEKKRSHFY